MRQLLVFSCLAPAFLFDQPYTEEDKEYGDRKVIDNRIEFENPPDNLDRFTEELDGTLQSINSDYEAKRYKNLTLQLPKVISLQPGTFYKWMQKRGKLGGQNKIPRLANDRKYLDELSDLLSR